MPVSSSARSLRFRPPSRSSVGFSLVELMVIVAIVAILAAVGMPAYVNYLNRVKQSEATNQLLTGRVEMEEFYTDNNRYARTIGCLPSFAQANTACLRSCPACTRTVHRNAQGSCKGSGCYTYTLENPGNENYRLAATRKIYSYAPTDRIFVSANTHNPVVVNVEALKWSVYKWLFE